MAQLLVAVPLVLAPVLALKVVVPRTLPPSAVALCPQLSRRAVSSLRQCHNSSRPAAILLEINKTFPSSPMHSRTWTFQPRSTTSTKLYVSLQFITWQSPSSCYFICTTCLCPCLHSSSKGRDFESSLRSLHGGLLFSATNALPFPSSKHAWQKMLAPVVFSLSFMAHLWTRVQGSLHSDIFLLGSNDSVASQYACPAR
jgi:hypothetical protein